MAVSRRCQPMFLPIKLNSPLEAISSSEILNANRVAICVDPTNVALGSFSIIGKIFGEPTPKLPKVTRLRPPSSL